ncbi:hypothetical protein E4U35_000931 [Claviceps purpurea]|nr:hypothetical protein E4U35_000931 [Claviceps purpurea]KAG6253072.1 hypothetical protein E4U23_008121 [Claviceps purpurea]
MVIKGGEGGATLGSVMVLRYLVFGAANPRDAQNMDDGSTRAAPLAGADITNSNTSSAPGH